MKITTYLFSCLIVFFCFACTDDDLQVPQSSTADEDWDYVEVPITLSTDEMEVILLGEEASRGIQDNEEGTDDTDFQLINNLWVIQYDGTANSAKLIGEAEYFSVDNDFVSKRITKVSENNYTITARLVKSSSNQTIVFLANTNDPELQNQKFAQGSTLEDLKNQSYPISSIKDLMSREESASCTGTDFPDDAIYRIMLNGAIVTKVQENMNLTATVKRNIARIDFKLKNSTSGDDKVSNPTPRLCGVPTAGYFYTNRDDIAKDFPDMSLFDALTFAEPAAKWTDGDYTTYRFYMPMNRCGTYSGNHSEALKPRYAPGGASFIQVEGTHNESSNSTTYTLPVKYNFFLGANMTSDYNVEPNGDYRLTVDLNDIGDPDYDERVCVESLVVDYTAPLIERANCYILNPSSAAGAGHRYRIPIDRIDKFWGNNGYENRDEYCLRYDRKWKCEIAWCDWNNWNSDLTEKDVKLTVNSGVGISDYIEVEVPYFKHGDAGFDGGNMVVSVRREFDDGSLGPILWNWYFWITDYNPDAAFDNNVHPVEGKYVYQIDEADESKGAVHRYKGSYWTSGFLADAFVMDRNIGAYDTQAHPDDFKGYMHYMAGHPIPHTKSSVESVYLPNGTATKSSSELEGTLENIIQNPTELVKAYAVTFWGDTHFQSNMAQSDWTLKSIFDPTPGGWRLPIYSMFQDFTFNKTESATTNLGADSQYGESGLIARGFPHSYDAQGMYYWPAGEDVELKIFYPFDSGASSSGSVNIWTTYCSYATFSNSGMRSWDWNYYANPIRPVRHINKYSMD